MSQSDALNVLSKLMEWYAATSNGPSAYAQLFDDDRSLIEHIAEALGAELPVEWSKQ